MLDRYPLRYLVHGFRGKAEKLARYLEREYYSFVVKSIFSVLKSMPSAKKLTILLLSFCLHACVLKYTVVSDFETL